MDLKSWIKIKNVDIDNFCLNRIIKKRLNNYLPYRPAKKTEVQKIIKIVKLMQHNQKNKQTYVNYPHQSKSQEK
jgi:hypothetical protein